MCVLEPGCLYVGSAVELEKDRLIAQGTRHEHAHEHANQLNQFAVSGQCFATAVEHARKCYEGRARRVSNMLPKLLTYKRWKMTYTP